MGFVMCTLYGLFALVAGLNLALMRRPRNADGSRIPVLIPARNEAQNLKRMLPGLVAQAPVYVFDDESTDGTAEIAEQLGATVLRASHPLPPGWTGKNRACHELAQAVVEDSESDWLIFLDADAEPGPGFVAGMASLARVAGAAGVVTGFPKVLPGRGIEPLFLAWVGWILLATNPFGIVSRTNRGHNRFTNGQVTMWRTSVYAEHWPNEAVRGAILEDVAIGRLMAKRGVGVEVVNLSSILSVRMYETWRQTLDGMSKNSYEITGSFAGTVLFAMFLLLAGWGWMLAGPLWSLCLGLFAVSGLLVAATARAPVWPVLLMPLVPSIAAFTLVRSLVWRRSGRVTWKGRTYDHGP